MAVNMEFAEKSDHEAGRIFGKYAHKKGIVVVGIDASGNLSTLKLLGNIDHCKYYNVVYLLEHIH